MDANGTRFHLLLGKGDWGRCTDERERPLASLWESSAKADEISLHWHQQREELILTPRLFQFLPKPKDNPPRLRDRRGAARDRFGNWYWIDERGEEILVNSSGTRITSHFWSPCEGSACDQPAAFGDFKTRISRPSVKPWRLSGLAITEDHYLVVGVLEPPGLLIFDLHSGGTPRQMLWPETVKFAPFDMASRPGGGVWILDRDLEDTAKPARYWALDRHFNVVTRDQKETLLMEEQNDEFQPKDGSVKRHEPQTFPQGVPLEAFSPLAALDAVAIEGLPDGTVLILDRNDMESFSLVYRYDSARQLGDPVSIRVMRRLIEKEKQPQFSLIAHDFAFVPEHQTPDGKVGDRLFLVGTDGNQAFAFDLSQQDGQLVLAPIGEYLPMRLFGGKGLVAAGDEAYYDFADRWVSLVEQRRPRYKFQATLLTPSWDGREPDCVWHRLTLDACIAPETRVEVFSRAANDERELPLARWQPEPALYLRGGGSEQPFAPNLANRSQSRRGARNWQRKQSLRPSDPTRSDGNGTWELLLQRARGRFLQLKLELRGDGRTTPRLRALRAYYPRFSYLERYLPGVYREDVQSASFLDRFLANLEGLYTSIEDKIAAAHLLFDERSAPAEALEWLAGWFGVALDPVWDERKRRLFIRYAMQFFQYRGTIHGLKIALRLALEECAEETIFAGPTSTDPRQDRIRIVEQFRMRRTSGVVLGDPTDLGGLPAVAPQARWLPALGRADLHSRYKEFLQQHYNRASALPALTPFPLRSPQWQKTSGRLSAQSAMQGFMPIAAPADQQLWQDFLARQYSTIASFNQIHGLNIDRFQNVPIPDALPPGSLLLSDWNAFISEKHTVWREFARQTLGFVPSAVDEEWQLWQDFLASRYPDIATLNRTYESAFSRFEDVPLPDDLPTAPAALQDWKDFIAETALSSATVKRRLWQDFLARRYRRIGKLNKTYEANWSGFDMVSLPNQLPPDDAPLHDWYQFESVVLAMHRTAHRFTVLLPVPEKHRLSLSEHQRLRDLAARIVHWEKPAHTVFDVKFYWNMFRVGSSRLGKDTLLDLGSRAPQLMSALILGQSFISESYLEPAHPQNIAEREILGRERLSRRLAADLH